MKGIFDVHGDHVRMKYFYIISTKCIFELQCTAAFFNIYQNDIDSKDKVNCGLRGRMKQLNPAVFKNTAYQCCVDQRPDK